MKQAIVIGASSGIGRALAHMLSENGYTVGPTTRQTERLEEAEKSLPGTTFSMAMDVSDRAEAMKRLETLIEEMGGFELVVISAGVGHINSSLEWHKEKERHQRHRFRRHGQCRVPPLHATGPRTSGCIVVRRRTPRKCARPGVQRLKGFRCQPSGRSENKGIEGETPDLGDRHKTGIRRTAMAKGDGLFWVAPPQKAARQIHQAIHKGAKRAM